MRTETKRVLVACQCGWPGEQRDLITSKVNPERHCPACLRPFKRVPSYRDDERSARDIIADGWPDAPV